MCTYRAPIHFPGSPEPSQGAGMGLRNRLKGAAAPAGVLRTAPRCMHSVAHSGASAVRPDLGPQEKPRKDTASVWRLPRPRPRTQALSRVSGEVAA